MRTALIIIVLLGSPVFAAPDLAPEPPPSRPGGLLADLTKRVQELDAEVDRLRSALADLRVELPTPGLPSGLAGQVAACVAAAAVAMPGSPGCCGDLEDCFQCCWGHRFDAETGCLIAWGTWNDPDFEPPLPGTEYYNSFNACMQRADDNFDACSMTCGECGPE